MDFALFFMMISLGFIGSFFSGLLGIGGAIINYPLLLFIPALLGVAHFSAQEVSSISMFQVFFASLSGVLAFRKRNGKGSALIHKGLVKDMGASILIGSHVREKRSNPEVPRLPVDSRSTRSRREHDVRISRDQMGRNAE